jgi:hypothetical protein
MAANAVVLNANASAITSANDYPSTLQAGQASNHRAVFTTPTGVAEGSTISLSFSSSFGTASITEDDIDVSDDGADLTTAVSCVGAEQASVAIASDVITIAICAGDGGAIAAGSQIVIEIGTNATASGTGTNRITNPSTAGTYFVTVAGAFGDDGSIALPIGADDSVNVSVQVPSRSSGGGAPVGGGGDTTPPIISNVVVINASATGATITWSTNEASSSMVDYGLTSAFELGTLVDGAQVTSHSIAITGLTAGRTYYFRVRSADISGNLAESSAMTFVTADTIPPSIISVAVDSVTTTSARVFWYTDEPATSVVAYGLTTGYGATESDTTLTTSHSVLLTGLRDGAAYHFQVLSTDASSNQSFSPDGIFITDDDVAPANVAGLTAINGNGFVTLNWGNPSDADLDGVRVLTCPGRYPVSPSDTGCSILLNRLAIAYTHTGLVNGNTYYYGVFAFDDAGQFASGALVTGMPSASEEEVPHEEDTEEDFGEGGEETEEPSEESGGGEEPSGGEDYSGEEGGGGAEEPGPGGEETATESATETADDEPSFGETSETPTSLSAGVGEFSDSDISYFVAGGALELMSASSGVVEVLPSSELAIRIPISEISQRTVSVIIAVGDETFLMRRDNELGVYEAVMITPAMSEIYPMDATVSTIDGTEEHVSSYLRVVPFGRVIGRVEEEDVIADGATIKLFELVGRDWVVWDASPFNQFNPISAGDDGSFAWYVPNGRYYAQAQAYGFEMGQTEALSINNSIVRPQIALVVIAEADKEKEETALTQPEIPSAAVVSVLEPILSKIVSEDTARAVAKAVERPIVVVQETVEIVREIPGVETAAVISTPTLAVTAGASAVVLATSFDFLPFLQYLFTSPVLLFWRRKRKSYGVVYNAISKTPVDLAMVRLYAVGEEDLAAGRFGKLVKSRVTDKGGRYSLLVGPGKYRLVVTKVGFQFPTEYLKGEKVDGQFLDVYHGEPIVVGDSGAVLTANVPMDPSQADKFSAPRAIVFKARLRLAQHVLAIGGFATAGAFAVIRPTAFSISMIGIQVLMYFLVKRLARPHRPIRWGIVYDKITGRPLSRTVARIFEPKYNKVLETQVTDSRGRYSFLLGPNEYFAVFDKEGYTTHEVRPIDYSQNKEPKDFSERVALEPSTK